MGRGAGAEGEEGAVLALGPQPALPEVGLPDVGPARLQAVPCRQSAGPGGVYLCRQAPRPAGDAAEKGPRLGTAQVGTHVNPVGQADVRCGQRLCRISGPATHAGPCTPRQLPFIKGRCRYTSVRGRRGQLAHVLSRPARPFLMAHVCIPAVGPARRRATAPRPRARTADRCRPSRPAGHAARGPQCSGQSRRRPSGDCRVRVVRAAPAGSGVRGGPKSGRPARRQARRAMPRSGPRCIFWFVCATHEQSTVNSIR